MILTEQVVLGKAQSKAQQNPPQVAGKNSQREYAP